METIDAGPPQAVSARNAAEDAICLRQALRRFATGVTIVTARRRDGTPVGLTVNSFGSVSLEPPLVLWSLSCASPNLREFQAAGHFAVNLLGHHQLELARRFAAPHPDRFASLAWQEGLGGAPVIEGSPAVFECARYAEYPGGDHAIFLGRVERLTTADHTPLVFFDGGFCAAPAAAARLR
ncbi:MAG TPA: flavin reductase family protein [Stellaceae bacterium]|nr:flavin reductase family protein [Stellaceae bacterium]